MEMNKDVSDEVRIPPSPRDASVETPKLLKCVSSATGNPRNKCALKPGHSLMDWIRLGNSEADLSGTCGQLIPVSKDELAKHNTVKDAWMAIRGFVYNVTHYMEFHPGGTEELMRGVGSDATKLFNDTHAWVNYSQLLNKCRVGPLTSKAKVEFETHKSLTLPKNPFEKKTKPVQMQQDVLPRLDWIQKLDDITLYFYTKQFCNPGLLIQNLFHEDCSIEIYIFIGTYVHKFDIKLHGRIKWPPKYVQIATESGKVEIKLNKHDEHINLWSDIGKYERSKMLSSSLELRTPLEYIFSKEKFNGDSFVMLLKNENIVYFLPVGYHLTIEGFINDKQIEKCYTPVPKHYAKSYTNIEMDLHHVCFLIKHYPNSNSFSQYLLNLENNATLKISLAKGNLKLTTLLTHKTFCFLAAGSGLTPFLSLIDHLLNRNNNRIEAIKLYYFNKTKADIWCNDILEKMSLQDTRFDFVNVLSNADESWSGLQGRVSPELLLPIVNNSIVKVSYIAACGPMGFITSVEKILEELHFSNENLFIF